MTSRSRLQFLLVAGVVLLSSCGGGKPEAGTTAAGTSTSGGTATAAAAPPTDNEASRFLTQATYGATDADIAVVTARGYAGWIDDQLVMPPSATQLSYANLRGSQGTAGIDVASEAFLRQAALGKDQLRLRMTLALSHIFVISGVDGQVSYYFRTIPDFWDQLHANSLGNFRTLLEKVALHPAMGLYLSTWLNDKGNPATGQQPDENFAREVMQLMTIGVYKLNPDGTRQLDGAGSPIAAYSHDDVAGLAKVFTGFYYAGDQASNDAVWGNYCFGCAPVKDFDITPMAPYAGHHSTLEKSFLGTQIPASTVSNPMGDLKIALDTLFMHPNVGPFLANRLIKQFVTSNPSPAYVKRVAAVFNDNGKGTRGDLGAVIRAILLDSEARDMARVQDPAFGKLREPVLRFTGWIRGFEAVSQAQLRNGPNGAGYLMYRMDQTDRFSQQPLWAPSVFDFWRADYSPPNSLLSAQGLEASEFQVVDEVSLTGYMNFMIGVVREGTGYTSGTDKYPDIHSDYLKEMAIAADETKLVARIDRLLTAGQMSDALRADLLAAVRQVAVPSGAAVTADQINDALKTRIQIAVYVTMVSPEYLAQR